MTLAGVTETYTQDMDCCGLGYINQLTVETENGGGGWFLILKTERWALDADEIDTFAATLKALLAREPKETA